MNSHCLFLPTCALCARFIAREPILIQALFTQAAPNPGAKARTPVRVQGAFPAITCPGYAMPLTGIEPAQHGISDNTRSDLAHHLIRAWDWYARQIQVPTPYAAAEAAERQTAVSGGFAAFGRQSRNPPRRYRALPGGRIPGERTVATAVH